MSVDRGNEEGTLDAKGIEAARDQLLDDAR